MQKKQPINKMILQKRLHLNFWGLLSHYALPLIFIGLAAMSLFYYIQYLNGSYSGRPIMDILRTGSIFLILALLGIIIQNRRLKFNAVPINSTKEEIVAAIEKTAKKRKWFLKNRESGFYQFYTIGGFSTGSWGELITIIVDKNVLFFNSICDPYNRPSVASFGQNRKHKNELFRNLDKKPAPNTQYSQ